MLKIKELDTEIFEKIIANIHNISQKKCGFKKFIEDLNTYLFTLKDDYLKILQQDSEPYKNIQQHIIKSIAHKAFMAKVNNKITTKKEFRILIHQINLGILFTDNLNYIVEKILFTLKENGKVIKKIPKEHLQRIIIESKGISLSSNVIKKCADLQIPIDFIDDQGKYYAQFTTYKATISQAIHKQAKIIGTQLQIDLAKEFVHSKINNQLNYIKYLNKYHKNLNSNINKISNILAKITNISEINVLMGYEGESSVIYWEGIRLVLKVPFEKRITFGAKDIVNSSLNYAYAILYGRIQHYLLQAGLSLNISFLHALDKEKPTLVFDMIEEFRSFIVDRTIISMFNKDEVIKLDNDGLLTKESRQRIAQNIKEKLGSYTMWKKESIKCDRILQVQCYQLAEVIKGNKKKYKGFIGKF